MKAVAVLLRLTSINVSIPFTRNYAVAVPCYDEMVRSLWIPSPGHMSKNQ